MSSEEYLNFSEASIILEIFTLTHFSPMLRFQGTWKWNIGLKWVKYTLLSHVFLVTLAILKSNSKGLFLEYE